MARRVGVYRVAGIRQEGISPSDAEAQRMPENPMLNFGEVVVRAGSARCLSGQEE
jgi:hypothetical protein